MIELDGRRAGRQIDGARPVGDRWLQIEHLEDPLEGHQRRHDVDVHVGELGERPVQPSEVGRERDQGADLQAALGSEPTAYPVDDRGRERGDQGERDEEYAAVHSLGHPDVTHPPGPNAEVLVLPFRRTIQLREHRSGHVESFRHRRVHLGVQPVALPGQPGQAGRQQAGRNNKYRQQHERHEGDSPGQHQHRGEHESGGQDIRQHRRQRVGERRLRAEHVVVQPADERPGLGPGEEGERLALHVPEHLAAHLVDQTLADPGREPALRERQTGVQERQARDDRGERLHEPHPVAHDAVIDDRLEDQRNNRTDSRAEHDEREKVGELPPMGTGEGDDPAQGTGPQRGPGDRTVLLEGTHRRPTIHSRSHQPSWRRRLLCYVVLTT